MDAEQTLALTVALINIADKDDVILEIGRRKRRRYEFLVREWIQERKDALQCNTLTYIHVSHLGRWQAIS